MKIRRSLTAKLVLLFALITISAIFGLAGLVTLLSDEHFVHLDQQTLNDKRALILELLQRANSTDDALWLLQEALNHHPGLVVAVRTENGRLLFANNRQFSWDQTVTKDRKGWEEWHSAGKIYRVFSFTVSPHFAPNTAWTIQIAVDKIREVIGSGGKVIREIVEKTGAKIDIGDDGTIKVAANDQEKIDAAKAWIQSIASEPEVGTIYSGKVVKVVDFGAFVNFFGAKDGLVHVSQIALERVANPADVLSEGQEVKVKFLGFDDRGKTKLSMKVVDQQTGEDLTDKINAERAERGEAPLSEDTGGRPKREGGDRDRGGDRGRRRRD